MIADVTHFYVYMQFHIWLSELLNRRRSQLVKFCSKAQTSLCQKTYVSELFHHFLFQFIIKQDNITYELFRNLVM